MRDRQWCRPKVDGVVLELKFTHRFPIWMRDLVQTFSLQRVPMAKYVACMQLLRRVPAHARAAIGALAT